MDPAHWEKVGSLLEQIRALPPEDRTAFLDRSTAGDAELRKQVSRLLAAYEQSTGFFGHLPDDVPLLGGAASEKQHNKARTDLNRFIGRSIAQYEILEQIGSGGMGVVYKAKDVQLKRMVALKFLLSEFARDAEARDRFTAEAHGASALDHPNICTIHEIGETEDGHLYIVMPFYEGETLNDRIKRGPIPPAEAIEIAAQVARGLRRSHEAGIIHRDIKPANVMITSHGAVKILDFGLAKVARDVSLTKTGTTMGTPAYMSPEQARGEKVDQRTDIWSLGVTLYEMLTGVRPFIGEFELAVLDGILRLPPVPLSALRSDIPRGVEAVVSRCLEKDRERRYGSAAELLVELEEIRVVRGRRWMSYFPRGSRRRRSALTAKHGLLLLTALVLTIGVWTVVPRSGSESMAGTSDSVAYELYEEGWTNLMEYVNPERVEASIALFERALQRDSGFALAWAGLGQAYWRQYGATGDTSLIELARTHTLKALEVDLEVVDAHVTLGMIHLGAGNVKGALTKFRLAQNIDSTNASVWRSLGDAYRFLGDKNAAENAYSHAIRLEPNYWMGYNKRGGLYYQFGDYEQAAKDFSTILELYPDNMTALNNLAGIRFLLERFDEAKANYERLIDIKPGASLHSNLGTIYFYHEQAFEQAANQYELALKYDPGNFQILANLAAAYDQMPGKEEKAQATYRQAMKRLQSASGWESDPLRLSALASSHAALGDSVEALSLVDKATTPMPKDVEVMINSAAVYAFLGDHKKASNWLCLALENGYSRGLVERTPTFEDLLHTRVFKERCE